MFLVVESWLFGCSVLFVAHCFSIRNVNDWLDTWLFRHLLLVAWPTVAVQLVFVCLNVFSLIVKTLCLCVTYLCTCAMCMHGWMVDYFLVAACLKILWVLFKHVGSLIEYFLCCFNQHFVLRQSSWHGMDLSTQNVHEKLCEYKHVSFHVYLHIIYTYITVLPYYSIYLGIPYVIEWLDNIHVALTSILWKECKDNFKSIDICENTHDLEKKHLYLLNA